ncbi:PfaB family protein [Oscillochloris sp. ZM17-4]|uniref:PfaB family protein n=1 Tax=Oscillochloris sp. ZM17-4 TaxID=2866714 RepID=UPI001C72FAD5|nr:PfaB family protein [Oscillochloris sp. ZM17-4]
MEPIAIIGLGCLFPGADGPAAFWQNLADGVDSTSVATELEIGADPAVFFDPSRGKADGYAYGRGGFVRGFSLDPAGLALSAAQLRGLDPLYQWALHVARQALADSGYLGRAGLLGRCGLALGNLSFPTRSSRQLLAPLYAGAVEEALDEMLGGQGTGDRGQGTENVPVNPINAGISGRPAAVVAEALGLGGPRLALDAACASSLYALGLACDYLNAGKADLMLAGAVSCADPLFVLTGFSIFKAYPPEGGASRPLDRSSRGLTAGEGAGMFALKRLADARRDGDKIYGVVRGVGLSNDGAGKHVLVPNPKGQQLAFERAYAAAGVPPQSVAYVECHATGTPVGDIVELNSMERFFGAHGHAPRIGSVKSNFGHLLTAAGMAGMLKVLLGMAHGQIPPTLGISDPLASEGGAVGGAGTVRALAPWPDLPGPRRAGVSAFGFGGTNAHVVLEGYGEHGRGAGAEIGAGMPAPISAPAPLRADGNIPLAITGMDACFGPYPDLAALDRGLYAGEGALGPPPAGRWQGLPDGAAPEGAYLAGFDFDFLRAKIPPDPADQPLPQQLLLLQVADRALRDAGVTPGAHVAVLVAMEAESAMHALRGRQDLGWQLPGMLARAGVELDDAERAELEAALKDALHPRAQVNQYVSFIGNIMACRVAALWDLSGPAFTVSADESSAFRALELAQLMLAKGELEAVVLAGVDLAGSVERATLDAAAGLAGRAVGEGAGALVLRRAADARRAGERIYATVDAVALMAPAPLPPGGGGAGGEGGTVGYLELSGGYAATIDGLREVYGLSDDLSCAVGAVAAQIGHAGAAAGIAALIRAALCLDGRYIPGFVCRAEASPADWHGHGHPSGGDASALPAYLPESARPWLARRGERRRAAVSGLDRDGCAAHVLLSAEPDSAVRPAAFAQRSRIWLIPIAAADRADLLAQLDQLEAQADTPLEELSRKAIIAYIGRSAAPYALALVARSGEELRRELAFARAGVAAAFDQGRDWETPLGSCFSARPLGPQAGLAFVYPGAFSAYPGLGRELFQLFPALHARMDGLLADAPAALGARKLYPRRQHAPTPADIAQDKAALRGDPLGMIQASLSFSLLLTAVLREQFGLRPRAALGYSMGEASMLWSLGAWRASDDALQRLRESPLFTRRLSGRREAARAYLGLPADGPDDVWCIYIAQATPDAARAALAGEGRAFLTHINTPGEVVISGAPDAVRRVIAELGCEAFRAPFDTVMHCPAMHSEYGLLVDLNRLPMAEAPGITFYGAADYAPLPQDAEQIAQSLARATCQPVDFPRLVERAYADGARIFVEPGPASACTRWVGAILAGKPHVALALNRQGADDAASVLSVLARLVTQRVPLDLTALLPPDPPPAPARSLVKTISIGGGDIPAALRGERAREILRGQGTGDRGQGDKGWRPDHAVENNPPPPLRLTERGLGGEVASIPAEVMVSEKEFPVLEESPVAVPPTIAGHRALLQRRHAELLALAGQIREAVATAPPGRATEVAPPQPSADRRPAPTGAASAQADARRDSAPTPRLQSPNLIWDTAELLEFAEGDIANVFGPEYAVIDGYARRVRLPLPPYLLVSRVTRLDARRGEFKPSTVTTEYDIPLGAWYSVDGQPPLAIAVESGQCDLLLISYLGIDFSCKGERVYRLLDCTLTFLDELPKDGETLRYDISINSFAQSGDTLLFFFSYECFVGERMVLKMDGGCAGFFTDAELDGGRGVVDSRDDIAQRRRAVRQSFAPPLRTFRRSLSEADLDLLIAGRVAACFGPAYDQRGRNPSLRLPARQMLMLSRVTSIDPQGGDWGLGMVIGEQDLTPDSWFFPCHFKDDQVMAGSLMADGCSQLLQIYMLSLGLQTYTFDARFQPVPNVSQVVVCRGQVLPCTAVMTYRLEVTALGLEPQPYAYANIDVILDGRVVVRFRDLALQLTEKSPQVAPPLALERPAAAQPPRYDEAAIQQFTTGSIAACFGPEYAIYDRRRAPRNPNGDLQLISRVVSMEGRRGEIVPGASLVAEYDVPTNPWFCRNNSYPTTPYAVLMEIALQPCGFLTSALGTTLTDPEQDFYFRNLDGTGHLLREVDLRGRRITARASLTSSNAITGMIIQKFAFGLALDGEDFYVGDAAFGYFSAPVLANQTGLDAGRVKPAWHESAGATGGVQIDLRGDAHPLFRAQPGRVHERLAGGQFGLLDSAMVIAAGGQHGAGYIYAEKKVDPASWFFPCHFYSDPVMPGSLGVEAILEAMQVYALHSGLGRELRSPHFASPVGQRTIWKYRGQILPSAGLMRLEVHISRVERRDDQIIILADASLWRDQLRIYEVRDLGLALVFDS